LSRTTLALVTAALALAVGGLALALALRGGSSGPGPLALPRPVSNSFGLPIGQGQPISLGVLDVVNTGKQTAGLDGAALVEAGAGIKLVGAHTLPC
jgi:hypothetical protein